MVRASDSGTNSTATAGGITTTNANDVVMFGVGDHDTGVYGAPGPGTWTSLDPIAIDDVTQGAWYRVVTATATYAPSVSDTGQQWDAVLVGFRVAP